MKRRQAGFTLTELMVVVAIIGVLVTMAIVYMRPRVRPIDVATRLGDLVREASRRAVALGPVRPKVAVALKSRARTRIIATQSETRVTFTLERLQEVEAKDSDEASWYFIEDYTTDKNVLAVQYAPGVGAAGMPATSTDWSKFTAQCRPDGICDAYTVFFQSAISGPDCTPSPSAPAPYEQCAKISIMPLGGAITTHPDWN